MLLIRMSFNKFTRFTLCLKSYTDCTSVLQTLQTMGGSPGDVSEEPVTQEKRKKSLRMSCDVSEATLIPQPFRHFNYVTAHSPTLPSLYLRHSSFSNPSVASLTSQLILQLFFRFSYVTISSLTSPGEPPMVECVKRLRSTDQMHMKHSEISILKVI